MSSKYVYDSSTIIAIIRNEPCDKIAEDNLEYSVMSVINMAEVITVLHRSGMPFEVAIELVEDMIDKKEDCDYNDAKLSARIKVKCNKFGLSLGDSFCLALGQKLKLPILTTDKVWKNIKDIDAEIMCIR